MFTWLISAALAVSAGICIVVQQGLNIQVRDALNSAVWAGFASYAIGLATMAVLALALREPLPGMALVSRVPWWVWGGGFFGALYIGLAILLVPQLGANTFVVLLVAGQMMTSIVIDHYGLFGLAQRPIDATRVLGVAFLLAGVVLVKR
ncbi:MAG: DMT family transporter [Bradyrhizobiaceae bacterium]|nr:MAG: DMT family transporter [Bradyrhizobiaceae bacterium]